ncbi:hypothetical protein SBRCBS47491_005820 [Sporothrix bragantina]|uniref:1-alkyl-2-acetylglycerophosphocholine esterase n=1 Tax=Sporothrix bragantina TaxID=671064 RepID=A0ABP0C1R6_9PEZI
MVRITAAILFATLATARTGAGVSHPELPPLLGPHPVGTISLQLTDYARVEGPVTGNVSTPASPRPRRVMVSVFYPTTNTSLANGNFTRAPYFPSPVTAGAFSSFIGNSSELLHIATRAYEGAPMARGVVNASVLVFSHGLGSSRLVHAAQLANIASHGWVVVAPDHPYDALITQFDDGTVVTMPDSVLDDFPNELPTLVDTRVLDVEFVVASLKNSSFLSQLPGKPPFLNATAVGVLGHSLGGYTAAQTVANVSYVPCGLNYDGGIFGAVAATGLDKPFLQVGASNHNQTTDTTFSDFWGKLRGFRREFTVNNTVHASFLDLPVLRDVLGDAFPPSLRNQTGTVNGARILQIEAGLVNSFFKFCLSGRGSSAKLDSVAKSFSPDITAREGLW